MNQSRSESAGAVYEGKIVVAGGCDDDMNILNIVESYDVLPNKWSPTPNMIKCKVDHSLVVVKHKLFVIGIRSYACELFDYIGKKFVTINSLDIYTLYFETVAINSKIIVFHNYTQVAMCYDVDKDEWSEESCEVTNNFQHFSCVKVPWY